MIDSQKIAVFDKYASAPANAFGSSSGKPSLVAESDKDVYWAIYEDLQKSCEEALNKTSYANKFYVKSHKYSRQKGIRSSKPKDLWCAIRNKASEPFMELPQIYVIASNRGLEVGFAVSIPEKDYSDYSLKLKAREILPLLHKKLPSSGLELSKLDSFLKVNKEWNINLSTRLVGGDKGFGVFASASELFNDLKSKGDMRGGGCICKVISRSEIVKSAVNITTEMIFALNIFGQIQEQCSPGEPDRLVYEVQKEIMSHSMEEFDPDNLGDGRTKVLKAIADRQGQAKFRFNLMEIYNETCVLTGCAVKEVLQAAHIVAYDGAETNKIDNGLILRSDIHDLFDKYLISINPTTLKIEVNNSLSKSDYFKLHGSSIRLPSKKIKRPSIKALQQHFNMFENINR